MSTPARRGLRVTRRALWYALAALLVLMALAAATASQLLPLLERNPERVADWLGERAGHPVQFDGLKTEWTRRGPLLRLDGLRIGRGGDAVTVGAAEVQVAQYAGLLPGRSLTELRLRNLDLVLERDEAGRWQVRGLPGQERGRDPFAVLERLGELQVIDASLTMDAPGLEIQSTIPRIDVRLRVEGDQVRAAARAWMGDGDVPVRAAAQFDRGSGNGRLYAGVHDAGLDAWAPLLRLAGVSIEAGHGSAEAWAELRDARVESLAARADMEGVALEGVELDGSAGGGRSRLAFDRVDVELEWALSGGGWRVDVPRLEVAADDRNWRIESLAALVGDRYALVADRVEAAPLLSALALSDRLAPGVRGWLAGAGANAVLEQVEMAGERGGPMRARALVRSAAFDPVGDTPGVSGLRGELVGDGDGVVFAFDPLSQVRFDWPSGFGVVHEVMLGGEVSAWMQDGAWHAQTAALRLDGEGYGADLRGGLRFQDDGGRPRIDIAARLDEVHVPVAKGFWVRHRMSERAIEWLDTALVDGRVLNGQAVISGDLDDWPFNTASGGGAPAGLFHAEAELADATLRFQPGWPDAEQVQGRLRFIANGFDFHGRSELAGVPVEQLEAGIADFGNSELTVTARAGSDAGQVIAMLQQTPLAVEALDEIEADGALEGSFAMLLPLRGGGDGPRIQGRAQLDGVQAQAPQWGLSLQDVRGELDYDQHGFQAPSLGARHRGRPGMVALRAGSGHVVNPEHAFEGELGTGLGASGLLERAPQLDWLQPHVSGRSAWTVGITVPRAGAGKAGSAQLLLQSDLVGTALELPAPLHKPAQAALPARIRIPLPLGDGEVGVQLGQRMALRARAGAGPPAVRVAMGGGSAGAPTSGLVIEGRTPELAAMDWAGLVGAAARAEDGEAGAGAGGRLALRRMDLQVDRLVLASGDFGSVHVGAEPGDEGVRLDFQGESLAGQLTLPDDRDAGLGGHFERLHWRRQAAAPAASGDETDDQAQDDAGLDPALVPPIQLSVADLRLEQAQLGNATLATSPIPGGMRIEQLETQSPTHHLVVSGDWTGYGAAARTRMETRVASGDFGTLLEGLGYQGHVRGGDGRLELAAAWPGSPTGFRTELLDGRLELSLRDGQLVEVEPGAGRLLGLLSVAELPRRMSLDFRDFFERGFAFNRIEGAIRVASGQARSDGLVMDGPAATIHITGQADLRERTYDQTIEVLPKSGNVLTAVGAIAGGPVGAAVGAMANAMLRKPLSELGATTYRVTGPWQEPKVEVVRREPPQVADGDPPADPPTRP